MNRLVLVLLIMIISDMKCKSHHKLTKHHSKPQEIIIGNGNAIYVENNM